MKVRVIEYLERKHELLCLTDDGNTVTVDPYVSCALDHLKTHCCVGKSFLLDDIGLHSDGCLLPEVFTELEEKTH